MCGRFQLTLPLEMMREIFEVANDTAPYPPRYNIAPTQPVHVVRSIPGGRAVTLMRWGLLPPFVKDPKDFPLVINGRSETAAEKPTFRNALRRRRALLPATGFYEWRRDGDVKQPFFFEPEAPIGLAGVWESWLGPNGEEMETVAVLTGEAEGVPAQYHGRMPLTVPRANFAAWLDPANDDGEKALRLTEKAAYTAHPVSRLLSNARNEGAGLMTPDAPEPPPPPPDEDEPRLL